MTYQGITNPQVMLIARNYESETDASQALAFNIVPQMFASENDFNLVMQTIAWFLPRQYGFLGVDENNVDNGFMPL